MEFPYKKRQRIPASCSVCRKRKSKCDRIKPVCGSCKKKSIAHLCYYESDKVELSPNDMNYGGIGPIKRNSPGEPPQIGHPFPDTNGIQGLYKYGPNGKPVNSEGFIPPILPYGVSGNVPNVSDRMYAVGNAPQMNPQHHNNQQKPQSQPNLPGQHQVHQTAHQPHQPHQPFTQNHTSPINQGMQPPPQPLQQQIPQQHLQQQFPRQNLIDRPIPNYNVPHQFYQNNGGSSSLPFPSGNFDTANSVHTSRPSVDSNMEQQLEPGASTPNLVEISIGPNSTLQVDPNDRIDVFSNASFSFLVEGPLLQQQGPLSYIGLTKSDPFLKFIRNYAITLFKSGSMSQFIESKSMKRRKKKNTSARSPGAKNSKKTDGFKAKFDTPVSINSDSLQENVKSQKVGDTNPVKLDGVDKNYTNTNDDAEEKNKDEQTIEEEEGEDGAEESDVVVEDGLIVTKIKVKEAYTNASEDNEKTHRIPQVLPGLKSLYQSNEIKQDYFELTGEAIVGILPEKKNMFMLFCRFFKYVYPFIPIVDESSLIIDINHVLPERFPTLKAEERYKKIEIKNQNDLVILGIVLLVIRLGYMSLIHNDETNNGLNEDERSMIADMQRINPQEYINVVNLCIPEEQTSQKSSFKLMQCLTLMYFYRLVTPDDCLGLGGTDSQILFGTIMKHAFAIGLNRDPTKYVAHENISQNVLLTKSWRALWHYLVSYDAMNAIHSGTVLNVQNLDMSDVQYPNFDSKTGKIKEALFNIKLICESYRSLSNLISSVQIKPKVVDILAETNKLERLFFNFFGKDFFKDYICQPAKPSVNLQSPIDNSISSAEHEEAFLKVIMYIAFVQLRTNLSCMYYKIAIFYENEHTKSNNSSIGAGFELFKIYIKSVVQLNYIMSYVVDNSVDVFGRNFDYILTANNEKYMIKTHAFLTSFFIRLMHHKKVLAIRLKNEKEGYNMNTSLKLEVTGTLFKMVLVEAELYVGNFRKLSKNYINSYRLYVMTYFVLKQCMEDPDVFFERSMKHAQFYHDGTNMIEFFSTAELQHLVKLCEEFKIAKDEQEKIHKRKEAVSPDSVRTYPTPMNYMNQMKSLDSEYSDFTQSSQNPSSTVQSSPVDASSSSIGAMNAIPGFDNPNMQNEDLLKLFEIYADTDQTQW
ncbi:unnamed protein product [Debaryomyces tyrocola]|nr:unnamed protein product [Debaryomyces tyrocola]